MYKFKLFIDFDKEAKWLEEMAKQGYHLQSTFIGYQFKRGEPETATIKIDFRKFKHQADFIDYCTMFADGGWEHIVEKKSSGIQYFKRKDDTLVDDIFSDDYSKAARYKRYATMFFQIALAYLPLFIVFVMTDIINFEAFLNPKALYFTPGLWEKTGSSFWFSFLFETPFAFMRGFAWTFIPLTILLYILFGYYSNRLYIQHKN